ncbi:MAG: PhnD/SsuA/transferrin family substrate-binding protein [Erysipelotrichaceae bacterium]|nr:PhnD/SsuA/transferrin family substrate-binding protein [Erysipelotrichaceae bacterium]
MKKLLTVLLVSLMALSLAACGSSSEDTAVDEGPVTVETLSIAFVPSKPADAILEAAEPLKEMLKEKLAEKGFEVGSVEISVGTDFAVVGEGMISGSIDVGFLNSSTYILYHDDGVNLLLEALRTGVGDANGRVIYPEEGLDPWNSGITTDAAELANGYAGLVYVNIATEKGADLYQKTLDGTLTWEDLDSARWNSSSVTSGSGYLYPSLWLNSAFGEGAGNEKRTIASLSSVVTDVAYSTMMENLLAGNCDVIVGYADIRKDAASTEVFEAAYADEIAAGTYSNVWDVVKIIGVSDFIMNDCIAVADEANDPKMTPEFVNALQEVFLEIGSTEEGLACVKPYSHAGYQVGDDSDYNPTRAAAQLFKD